MNYKRLLDSIKKHEGFKDRVYKDTLGFDTIGYGCAIKNLVLDEDIAGLILERKMIVLIMDVYSRFPWIAMQSSIVQEVVIEMSFQLGVKGVSKFKMTLRHLQDDEYKMAAEEMLDSKWARQTPNRAKELSEKIKGIK